MQKEILDYIKSQRVGVLAVEMLDGSPHGATVHFAFDSELEVLICMTNPKYKKHESLEKNKSARASFVIGVSEEDMRTMQIDGEISLTDEERYKEIYFKKFPEKIEKFSNDVFFIFKPIWWRFTDWTRPEGKTIYTSDGEVVVLVK